MRIVLSNEEEGCGVGAGDGSASPKVLICRKSEQNLWKLGHRCFDTIKWNWRCVWLFFSKKGARRDQLKTFVLRWRDPCFCSVDSKEKPARKLGGPLKEKCITVTLVPFASKVFTHYNCCWGPLWKQSSPLIHCSCCWAPLKAT